MSSFKNVLIQFNKFGMGVGDPSLSLMLAKNYLNLLKEENELPKVIAFYNEGVKLFDEDSIVLDELKELETRGVKLLACKTCLKFYNLLNKTKVGLHGTMMDIIEVQKASDKVISL